MFHQAEKALPKLSYREIAGEGVKLVLSTLVGHELNHESPLFRINNARDVADYLINILVTIQDLRYNINPYKQAYGYIYSRSHTTLIMSKIYI